MSLDLSLPRDLILALLPELVLTAWAVVLLVVVAWRHRTTADLRLAGGITLAALASTAVAVWWLWWHRAVHAGVGTMVALDDFRYLVDWLVLGTAALTVCISAGYLEREGMTAPEYYVLLLFATLGMMLMAGAEDLMVIFLGLELMSVAVYVLAGLNRRSPRAAEAALKYFLLGAFASGFLVYGIALVFGAAGTTNLGFIGVQTRLLDLGANPLLALGLGLMVVGFGFKIAAVPFHMWAPDVYDGAPTPVTAYMATGVKAAAVAALLRILIEAFPDAALWRDAVRWLAIATMIVGNLVALAQRSLKRMLAYSSIAHAGYLLVAVVPGSPVGTAAAVFYVAAYTLMTLAAFALLTAKGREGESEVRIDDLAGLALSRPWVALALAICMLSLLGFPGTAGFIGKWYILTAAMDAGELVLAAVLVLASVVSAGYYLPVIMVMYMQAEPAAGAHAGVRLPRLAGAAVTAAVVGLVLFGLWPNRLLDLARDSGAAVRPPAGLPTVSAGPDPSPPRR